MTGGILSYLVLCLLLVVNTFDAVAELQNSGKFYAKSIENDSTIFKKV